MSNEFNAKLDEAIPRSVVSTRSAGNGRNLSYLSGHYVINRLNEVFGNLNWATEIKSLEKLYEGREGDYHYVSYGSTVRLVVTGPEGKATEHTDCGFGDGKDRNPGKPHELARKEAVTDALKRCAKNLGMSLGLALYDKEQPNVFDDNAPSRIKTPSAVVVPNTVKVEPATAESPKSNREGVNKTIGLIAKIVNSKGIKTFDQLKEDMKKNFGTDVKEQLTDEQADKFLSSLKEMAQ